MDGQPPEVARCYPEQYDTLLAAKVSTFEAQLAEAAASPHGLPETQVFTSEPLNFRMRASFSMWRDGADVHYIMYNKPNATSDEEEGGGRGRGGKPKRGPPHEVVTYPMGSRRINELMPVLREEVMRVDELRLKINDVRFLTTTTGDALISMTYNRPIDANVWGDAARELAATLGGDVRIVGRSRKVKIVVGGETVSETLQVPGRGACHYTQTEGAFTQPNAGVCEKMLGWAYDATRDSQDGDLCELYCGNGCFTVALAPNFRHVVATELSKASVELADANLARNGVQHARVARLSADEFAEAVAGTRRFARLDEAGIELPGAYRFSTLLVDPPRAGLDAACRALAATFARIVYISCNPESLARDVAELRATHRVTRLAAFDQFPYTPHLECGLVLERRAEASDGRPPDEGSAGGAAEAARQ